MYQRLPHLQIGIYRDVSSFQNFYNALWTERNLGGEQINANWDDINLFQIEIHLNIQKHPKD